MEQAKPENDAREAEPDEVVEPFHHLAEYLDTRPELGLRRMLANLALEPRDPFKPEGRRTFRKGFIMAAFFLTAFVAWFAWFNLVR